MTRPFQCLVRIVATLLHAVTRRAGIPAGCHARTDHDPLNAPVSVSSGATEADSVLTIFTNAPHRRGRGADERRGVHAGQRQSRPLTGCREQTPGCFVGRASGALLTGPCLRGQCQGDPSGVPAIDAASPAGSRTAGVPKRRPSSGLTLSAVSALTPSERRELEREGMRQVRLQERRDAQIRADAGIRAQTSPILCRRKEPRPSLAAVVQPGFHPSARLDAAAEDRRLDRLSEYRRGELD